MTNDTSPLRKQDNNWITHSGSRSLHTRWQIVVRSSRCDKSPCVMKVIFIKTNFRDNSCWIYVSCNAGVILASKCLVFSRWKRADGLRRSERKEREGGKAIESFSTPSPIVYSNSQSNVAGKIYDRELVTLTRQDKTNIPLARETGLLIFSWLQARI